MCCWLRGMRVSANLSSTMQRKHSLVCRSADILTKVEPVDDIKFWDADFLGDEIIRCLVHPQIGNCWYLFDWQVGFLKPCLHLDVPSKLWGNLRESSQGMARATVWHLMLYLSQWLASKFPWLLLGQQTEREWSKSLLLLTKQTQNPLIFSNFNSPEQILQKKEAYRMYEVREQVDSHSHVYLKENLLNSIIINYGW